ncbi:response regulator [Desulfobaculum senezii]|jgi:DNA-binding NtrC family response regulator|uniref:response regulator n=1 Tax=Desulfobaculum sp. SPO524 TaxID=3378071 RepID=UPI0038542F18
MTGVNVLLVDDNKDFVETLAERLRTRGMDATAVYNGRSAVDAIDARRYDAVVLDLQMPDMDGLETLRRIKEHNDEVQIILLSGHATVELSVEAMKLGALDFMEKPADFDTLVKKITVAQAKRLVLEEEHNNEKIQSILSHAGW